MLIFDSVRGTPSEILRIGAGDRSNLDLVSQLLDGFPYISKTPHSG